MSKVIYRTIHFNKHYIQRIESTPALKKRYIERVNLFLKNPKNPILRSHALIGNKKGQKSFSITGDYRIIFEEFKDYYLFLDIGTHSQVYG